MNGDLWFRLFASLLVGAILGAGVWLQAQRENDPEWGSPPEYKYRAAWNGSLLLPVFFCLILAAAFFRFGAREALTVTFAHLFGLFLHISIYCVLLMLFLPICRKVVSSRACAFLWLLPAALYITNFITNDGSMGYPRPSLVLSLPLGKWIIYVWFAGFLLFLSFQILSHLLYRREILSQAREVEDLHTLEIFYEELKEVGLQNKSLKPMISPGVKTPLSIGLFSKTLRLVLPPVPYTDSELRLIFRHELIHITREDSVTKLFLTFTTAICWFNPLMWIAMRKSAEEIELSCDETVLLDASPETRKQYADLILDTAGNARGFTTCLSASASSLRYRLRSVIHPRKTSCGALLVAAVFTVLSFTCGNVALAYGNAGLEKAIEEYSFPSRIEYVNLGEGKDGEETRYYRRFQCADPEAFHAYLNGLNLNEMVNAYSFNDGTKEMTVSYGQEAEKIILRDHYVEIDPGVKSKRPHKLYYSQQPVDLTYLRSLLIPDPLLFCHLNLENGSTFLHYPAPVRIEENIQPVSQSLTAPPPPGSRTLQILPSEPDLIPPVLEITSADGSDIWRISPDSSNNYPIPDGTLHCKATVWFEDDFNRPCQAVYQFRIDAQQPSLDSTSVRDGWSCID